MADMEQIADIIKRVTDYANAVGLAPTTVCGNATGNKRLLERLERRAARTLSDIQRLEAFMDANAPKVSCPAAKANRTKTLLKGVKQ